MSRLITLDAITRLVLPQCLPAPQTMVEDAIGWAAKDFFEKSEVWTETFEEMVGYGEVSVQLMPQRRANIVRILEAYTNGIKLYPGEYSFTNDTIFFQYPASAPFVLTAWAVMRPSRYVTELPENFVEEYGDTIAFGALARIKAMSGKGIEWTDGDGAAVALKLYNEGVADARIEVVRARHGGDILAVGQEYI